MWDSLWQPGGATGGGGGKLSAGTSALLSVAVQVCKDWKAEEVLTDIYIFF